MGFSFWSRSEYDQECILIFWSVHSDLRTNSTFSNGNAFHRFHPKEEDLQLGGRRRARITRGDEFVSNNPFYSIGTGIRKYVY